MIKQAGYTPEYTHERHITDCWPNGIEGVDYVECKLCKFAGMRIKQHVENVHGLRAAVYEGLYGPTKCAITKARYSASGKMNGDWIERKKADGEDLATYRTKMSAAVSSAIMSNDAERARRSMALGDLNKRDDFRKRSSEAAKRTSARKDIINARTKQLAAWRAQKPEEFYNKCVSKMIGFKTSKPEKWMLAWVQREFPEYEFKGNQRLKSVEHFHLTQSQKRQLDVFSKKHKIIIEIDGILHFKNIEQWDQLDECRAKDNELNVGAPALGYVLIRISHDQWDQRTGEVCNACLEKVKSQITSGTPGVYCNGKAYAEDR